MRQSEDTLPESPVAEVPWFQGNARGSQMQNYFRHTSFGIALLIMTTVGMAVVLLPFWKPLFWAVVLAILFWPLRTIFVRWLRGRTVIASSMIVLLVLVFVLFPAFLIVGVIADGAIAVMERVQSGAFQPGEILESIPGRFPWLESFLPSVGLETASIKDVIGKAFVSVAHFSATKVADIGQGASVFIFQMFLALYVFFSLLLYGDSIYRTVFNVFPASQHTKINFFGAFSEMAVATIKGMISVGVVQAFLGAMIFWLVGIESAAFWGALMGLLSVLPPFGAGFIWAPAGLMMVLNGNIGGGLILLAYGAGVISTSDNIVRPIVVGRSSSVPSYLVLVTTLGGLAMFGLTGLVLGPVIASLFLSAWQLFDEAERVDASPEPPDWNDTQPKNLQEDKP